MKEDALSTLQFQRNSTSNVIASIPSGGKGKHLQHTRPNDVRILTVITAIKDDEKLILKNISQNRNSFTCRGPSDPYSYNNNFSQHKITKQITKYT